MTLRQLWVLCLALTADNPARKRERQTSTPGTDKDKGRDVIKQRCAGTKEEASHSGLAKGIHGFSRRVRRSGSSARNFFVCVVQSVDLAHLVASRATAQPTETAGAVF